MISPLIVMEPFIERNMAFRSMTAKEHGTISATVLPWRVMRIGCRVRRTRSRSFAQFALNSDIETSRMPFQLSHYMFDSVLRDCQPNPLPNDQAIWPQQ